MKRYIVEEQMDGTYKVFFVNKVTSNEEFLKDTFSNLKDAQLFCGELNSDVEDK